jgi:hypothetical protein
LPAIWVKSLSVNHFASRLPGFNYAREISALQRKESSYLKDKVKNTLKLRFAIYTYAMLKMSTYFGFVKIFKFENTDVDIKKYLHICVKMYINVRQGEKYSET